MKDYMAPMEGVTNFVYRRTYHRFYHPMDKYFTPFLKDDYGHQEVNLNLGCPSGTVTAKGKGAGFLAEPQKLDQFLDQIFSKLDMKNIPFMN